MTFTDETYFIGDLNLPQTANKFQLPAVQRAIEKWEPSILREGLGYELYELVQAAWDAFNPEPPGVPVPLDPRFDALINGAEFSFQLYGGYITTKWIGLVNDEKISMLTYYVYYKYRVSTETRTTTTGEAKVKKENAQVISPYNKLERLYNDMIDLYGVTPKPRYFELRKYRQLNEYFLDQSVYQHFGIESSLYNFLMANIGDYPEWVYQPKFKSHFI